MNKLIVTSLFAMGLLLFSCASNPRSKIAGNYDFRITCLGTELDGSQTVEVWGYGRNRFDAAEQAKKNAVYAVVFKGITDGRSGCEKKPLITEVNAREKYETYFNLFFGDKGKYQEFVSLKDERIGHKIARDQKGAHRGKTNSVIVRVLRPQLKQQLIQDNILKESLTY
jgi:hypothetical protein